MTSSAPFQRAIRALVIAGSLTIGCNTGGRDVETPEGSRSPDQNGPFIILGVISRNTSTLSRHNAYDLFQETVKLNVPVGTEIIIPTLRGVMNGYGSTTPEDLSTLAAATWNREDHNFGLQYFNVYVSDIDAPDMSTMTQTASVVVEAQLSDDNGDDDWFGDVNYTLICLGKHP
jgi:hypothetical protein